MAQSRSRLQFSIKAVLVLTLLVGLAASRLRIRLKVENFAKVEDGMTYGEVCDLLGGKPGHYGWNYGSSLLTAEGFAPRKRMIDEKGGLWFETIPHTTRTWTSDHVMFHVAIGDDGRVVGKHRQSSFRRYSLMGELLGWESPY